MTIEAVVFDMDGVLIDARDWHYEALNRALALLGYTISRYDHLSTYDGLPTRRKLEMLSLERGLPRALHGFLNDLKQQYTMELVHARCKPVFQHEFALSNLRSRGYRLAVASNSVGRTVEVMLERANLAPYLSATVSNEDVTRAKPDPEMYALAMERLGVAPARTLVVEDNEHGIQAAQAAGAHVLVVKDPLDVTLDRIEDRIRELEGVTA
jgi:HAD superfamily hydrolase (TIGR01509 family)